MRFREEKPGDLDRARAAVGAWRARNPAGTPEQLIAAVGGGFHADWGVVLRGVLAAVDRHRARAVTGIITGPAEAGEQACDGGKPGSTMAFPGARPSKEHGGRGGARPRSAPPQPVQDGSRP